MRMPRARKVVLTLIAVAVTVVFLLGQRYGISAIQVSRLLVRGVALTVIELAVKVHDPTPGVGVVLGPAPSGGGAGASPGKRQLAALVRRIFPSSTVEVTLLDNEPLRRSRYAFGYQPASEPKLGVLRGYLQGIVAQENDLDEVLAVADWVNAQWTHGTSGRFDPGGFDATQVLAQARQGARFWCHVSAMTFVQLAVSLGHQGRLVSLSRSGYLPEHAVAEIWSNRYRKWVMIDPDFNIWYQRNGVPLNVLEIHELQVQGRSREVTVVRGRHRPSAELEARIPFLTPYYRYFEIDLRNDWLTNRYFPGHPARSDRATLVYDDLRLPEILTLKTRVHESSDLYWDLNRTVMYFEARGRDQLLVRLDTVTPNFSRFEVVVDNRPAMPWATDSFVWKLHPGANSLRVRSLNCWKRKGVASEVVVTVGSRPAPPTRRQTGHVTGEDT